MKSLIDTQALDEVARGGQIQDGFGYESHGQSRTVLGGPAGGVATDRQQAAQRHQGDHTGEQLQVRAQAADSGLQLRKQFLLKHVAELQEGVARSKLHGRVGSVTGLVSCSHRTAVPLALKQFLSDLFREGGVLGSSSARGSWDCESWMMTRNTGGELRSAIRFPNRAKTRARMPH